jgi:hypothetical protein
VDVHLADQWGAPAGLGGHQVALGADERLGGEAGQGLLGVPLVVMSADVGRDHAACYFLDLARPGPTSRGSSCAGSGSGGGHLRRRRGCGRARARRVNRYRPWCTLGSTGPSGQGRVRRSTAPTAWAWRTGRRQTVAAAPRSRLLLRADVLTGRRGPVRCAVPVGVVGCAAGRMSEVRAGAGPCSSLACVARQVGWAGWAGETWSALLAATVSCAMDPRGLCGGGAVGLVSRGDVDA